FEKFLLGNILGDEYVADRRPRRVLAQSHREGGSELVPRLAHALEDTLSLARAESGVEERLHLSGRDVFDAVQHPHVELSDRLLGRVAVVAPGALVPGDGRKAQREDAA